MGKNNLDLSLTKGNKSPSDKILIINAKECPVSFKQVARMVARICKNEEVLTEEKDNYVMGSRMFRNYLMLVFQHVWKDINDEDVDDELDKIYNTYFGRRK